VLSLSFVDLSKRRILSGHATRHCSSYTVRGNEWYLTQIMPKKLNNVDESVKCTVHRSHLYSMRASSSYRFTHDELVLRESFQLLDRLDLTPIEQTNLVSDQSWWWCWCFCVNQKYYPTSLTIEPWERQQDTTEFHSLYSSQQLWQVPWNPLTVILLFSCPTVSPVR